MKVLVLMMILSSSHLALADTNMVVKCRFKDFVKVAPNEAELHWVSCKDTGVNATDLVPTKLNFSLTQAWAVNKMDLAISNLSLRQNESYKVVYTTVVRRNTDGSTSSATILTQLENEDYQTANFTGADDINLIVK